MVPPDARVADIGTDHGYLGIHLLQAGISPHVIACDLRKGPLENARRNARQFGAQDAMEFRLSDGLEKSPRRKSTVRYSPAWAAI